MPTLASAFQPRPGLRQRIEHALSDHYGVVLTQGLAGGGGLGKTQMAATCAHQALATGTQVVVWVNAAETEQIITSYATAAHRVQAPGALGQDAEADARAFLDWLAATPRSWLIVLDDLTDLETIGPWWPPPSLAGNGWMLATTRRREALLSGGNRRVIDVGTYTRDEAQAYLAERFTDTDGLLDQQAPALAEELGWLPLALAHAAAYMINEDVTCTQYLQLFRQSSLDTSMPLEADTEGYGRGITAALLLTLDAAQHREPVGLAAPAILLAAHLDPAGHPQRLWAENAIATYLGATPDQSRAALRLLHRYGLLTCDSRNGPRAVRLHALTARAARETAPAPTIAAAARTAADALAAVWPDTDQTEPELSAVLRANTDTLAAHAGDLLWQSDGPEVLERAGKSLLDSGLYGAAVTHHRQLAADCERLLGEKHPDTLTACANLAVSYRQVGRTAEAIMLGERVLANRERLLGGKHPDTLTARANLAEIYEAAGQTAEAIMLGEHVLANRERLLGGKHRDTLTARNDLAAYYLQAGRTAEAITLEEHVLADLERLLGEEHPDTLTARANLAVSYGQVGRTAEAITLEEGVLADSERLLGGEHPDTLTARANLAASYRQAGRTADASRIAG
ncbi:tetratricopeptide repeat protein [Streptomyces sp. NPDC058471]|uniref:tetratricopeptide repeat protein n=1 Tax=Streptomyces sp. NPDC058471 TaxID=3346516 RepID=UPI0036527AFB